MKLTLLEFNKIDKILKNSLELTLYNKIHPYLLKHSMTEIIKHKSTRYYNPEITVYFDGSCEPNPGIMGIGVHIVDSKGKKITNISQERGAGTNNAAEYLALIEGLSWLVGKNYQFKKILVCGDSKLILNQITGKWKTKRSHLQRYLSVAQGLVRGFKDIEFQWIPRKQNNVADSLSTSSLRPKETD